MKQFEDHENNLLTLCNDYPDTYKVKIDYTANEAHVLKDNKIIWKLGKLDTLFEKMLRYSDIVPCNNRV